MRGEQASRPDGTEVAPGVFTAADCDIDRTAKIDGPVVLGEGAAVGPRAVLEGPVVLGPGASVGEGSRVAGSVLHRRARIGPQCEVEGSIVGEEAVLRERVTAAEVAVVGPGAEIEPDNELRRGIRVWPDVVVPAGSIRF